MIDINGNMNGIMYLLAVYWEFGIHGRYIYIYNGKWMVDISWPMKGHYFLECFMGWYVRTLPIHDIIYIWLTSVSNGNI